jgi:hypothetical protein
MKGLPAHRRVGAVQHSRHDKAKSNAHQAADKALEAGHMRSMLRQLSNCLKAVCLNTRHNGSDIEDFYFLIDYLKQANSQGA